MVKRILFVQWFNDQTPQFMSNLGSIITIMHVNQITRRFLPEINRNFQKNAKDLPFFFRSQTGRYSGISKVIKEGHTLSQMNIAGFDILTKFSIISFLINMALW